MANRCTHRHGQPKLKRQMLHGSASRRTAVTQWTVDSRRTAVTQWTVDRQLPFKQPRTLPPYTQLPNCCSLPKGTIAVLLFCCAASLTTPLPCGVFGVWCLVFGIAQRTSTDTDVDGDVVDEVKRVASECFASLEESRWVSLGRGSNTAIRSLGHSCVTQCRRVGVESAARSIARSCLEWCGCSPV